MSANGGPGICGVAKLSSSDSSTITRFLVAALRDERVGDVVAMVALRDGRIGDVVAIVALRDGRVGDVVAM